MEFISIKHIAILDESKLKTLQASIIQNILNKLNPIHSNHAFDTGMSVSTEHLSFSTSIGSTTIPTLLVFKLLILPLKTDPD
jgi:hypothetical protein